MLCHADCAVVVVVGIITKYPNLAVLMLIAVPEGALDIVQVEMLVALSKLSTVVGTGTGAGAGVGVGCGEGAGAGAGAGTEDTFPILIHVVYGE